MAVIPLGHTTLDITSDTYTAVDTCTARSLSDCNGSPPPPTALATEALQKPTGDADALGVATDCADAVVGIGVAIRSTDHANAEIEIAGPALGYIRRVLHRAVELARDGTWPCPCSSRHTAGVTCRLQDNLISDLNLVGGWYVGARERPAGDR
jgi:hypothetical protein